MHARWLSFLQQFDFVIKYKDGTFKAADALSRTGTLLTLLQGEIIVFSNLPSSYANDPDFNDAWKMQ